MQSGKSAMASAKETAGNIAASAQAGMEKTKATVQEKVEKLTARGPAQKETAEERKQERLEQAEINKQQAREQHAAEAQQARAGGHHPGVVIGHTQPGSAAPGEHATGAGTMAGVAQSRPVGVQTGTGRTAAHNPLVSSDRPGGHGTGGGYA